MADDRAFLRAARVDAARVPEAERDRYPWSIPAVQALWDRLDLDAPVTFVVGQNGSGKSTLIEAIAVAAGMNAEGGSSGFMHSSRDSHSPVGDVLTLARGYRRPRTDFFLRAESVFTVATYLEQLPDAPLRAYGGRSLHEQSHGESFLAIALHRLGPGGLYLLDEPEAALSFQGQLALLLRIKELADHGAQWIVATHSPVLVACPGARILLCDEDGIRAIEFDEVPSVQELRRFLRDPERQIQLLLGER